MGESVRLQGSAPPRSRGDDSLFNLAKDISRASLAVSVPAFLDGKRVVAEAVLQYVRCQLVVAEANSNANRTDYAAGVYDTLLGVVERCEAVIKECTTKRGV